MGSGVLELSETPNAVQADEDGQDTPNSKSPCGPPGLRVCWSFHFVPFQRSATVSASLALRGWYAPTAVQSEGDEQSML
jgi:hypothetical protein